MANCFSTNDPMTAPDTPQDVIISFEKGTPTKVSSNGKEWTDPLELFLALGEIGRIHSIGRIDIVEVCYWTLIAYEANLDRIVVSELRGAGVTMRRPALL